MRAIVVDRWTEPKHLTVREAPEPKLLAGHLGVEVKAAGCNFFDILMVQGRYQVRPPFPFIPGAELAGVVREVGPDVAGFAVGDRVLASVPLGAFAERAVVAAKAAWKMPAGMSFEQGAALPIVYPTSYAALVFRAHLQPGENLLVHAAAGGVGLAAVQIGKALGARVLGTAGGPDKLEVARKAGSDVVIDYRDPNWVDEVKRATGGRGADVIYDSVGGEVTDQSLKCIAWNGRLLVIGFASGPIPAIKANRILLKNIAVIGLHWGAYAVYEPERIPETFDALFRLFSQGKIEPVIYGRYALEELPLALEALAARKTHGKVIVVPVEP
ncbi:MAG TPA: NADPH:quinone oxidoreductase family protein [Myxococcota bacterium]|nr:NADPH:quinone oxidoreductase family protein [Myxococcota bacterium]